MSADLIYQIGLSLVPHIGPVQTRLLLEHFDTAKDIFDASRSELKSIEGIGEVRATKLRNFDDWKAAEEEISFLKSYDITPLFMTEQGYPHRLLHCTDAPALLYYKGTADLNAERIISIVGTRMNTRYGEIITRKLVAELASYDVTIVSGLAHGIDAIAHRAAVELGITNIAALGHGLDKIYPSDHTELAKSIINNGGLLSEFRIRTHPGKYTFPSRNRVIAGMSDATIVIETASRGGSMITADLANGYHREVFAIPGRVSDDKSAGCNDLIRKNKAHLLTDVGELAAMMNWS